MFYKTNKLKPINKLWLVHLAGAFSLLVCQLSYASDALYISQWSHQVGLDTWQLSPSVKQDPTPWNAQNTNLLLPNAATKWSYSDTSHYVAVIGKQSIQKDTFLSLKVKADQAKGLRLDEAMIQYDISPSLAVRAGVVNYKTSWCRTYEPDNGWVQEIETICVTKNFQDVTGSAPGLQLATNNTWGNYLVQKQIGIYRPLAFNYAPKEFGNYYPSPNFQVDSNRKFGFNVNVLNLDKAFEARLSYIRATQSATLPEQDIRGTAPQTSDLWYLGVASPITHRLSARLTKFMQHQNIECWSQLNATPWCNTDVVQKKGSTTLELAYRVTPVDLLSVGISQTKFDTNRKFYTPQRTFMEQDFPFYIETRHDSVAWRHDWASGMFGIAQILLAQQKNGFDNLDFSSHGNAIGLRIGVQR
jgi:hypothetical protein